MAESKIMGMAKIRVGAFALVMALVFFGWPAAVFAQRPASATGTFSSMYFHPEAGDLLGTEIRIVYTRNGFQGTYQQAQGEPSELILFKPIIDDDNHITFSFTSPWDGTQVTISGRITDAGLETKRWKGDRLLKRMPSYWDERRASPP